MGMIGLLGKVPFICSDRRILTFSDLGKKTARFATHNIIGQKPVLEYLGPDADTVQTYEPRAAVKAITFAGGTENAMDGILIPTVTVTLAETAAAGWWGTMSGEVSFTNNGKTLF